MASEPDSRNQILKDFGLFFVAASEIVVSTGIGVGAGYWAWSRWGFPWWVLLITSLAGLGLAMWRIYRAGKVLGKDSK